MADHYFTAQPESEHRETRFDMEFLGKTLHFMTDAGVFSRKHVDPGSQLLCRSLREDLQGDVLDMGCGWGAMTVMTLSRFAHVRMTMSDINERALELARANVAANGMQAASVLSDCFAGVDGSFDAVIMNPPIRAGKSVIYGMFRDALDHLRPGGELWLVIRKKQGADSAKKYLETLYARVETAERDKGYHILRCVKEENDLQVIST